MNLKRLALLCAVIMMSSLARAEDTPVGQPASPGKPWKNETEFSFVSANGNSKSQTISGKETFTYVLKKTTFEVFGGGLGGKSEGSVVAEQYHAGEKISYKLSDRNYTFEKFLWEKDRFAGIRNRYDTTAGFGREVIKTDTDNLIAELSGGWTAEERIADEDKDFGTGRAYLKYVHTISPTAKFSQDAEYIENLDDSDDFRVKTETALIAALSTHLSLKASYVWKYVGVPPAALGRSDTLTTIALIAVY